MFDIHFSKFAVIETTVYRKQKPCITKLHHLYKYFCNENLVYIPLIFFGRPYS